MTTDQLINYAPGMILLLVLGYFWLMAFFTMYHFIRFGIGVAPKKAVFVFMIGLIVLSGMSFVIYSQLEPAKIAIALKNLMQKN